MTQSLSLKEIFVQIQTCKPSEFSSYVKSCSTDIIKNKIPIVDFQHILSVILLNKSKIIPPKITIFLKKVIEEINFNEKTSLFNKAVIDHLLKTVSSKNKRVRSNSIFLLHLLNEDIDITDDIITTISARLFDKDKLVRKEAVRFLSKFQDRFFKEDTYIYHLFKDLLRHDPFFEVRKEVLECIVINKFTIKSIIERIVDSERNVRKSFYSSMMERLELNKLDKENLEFIVNKCFVERQIECKHILVNKIVEEYDIKNKCHEFIGENSFNCVKELLFLIFEKTDINVNEFPSNLSESLCLRYFLEFKELRDGKENLKLPDIIQYSEHVYKICIDNKEKNENIIKNIFSIYKHYEMFSEESKKLIKCTIYKLLVSEVSEIIIEECIVVLNNVCNDKNLLGSILKENMINNQEQALLISKYVMKHVFPFEDLHSATIEWVLSIFREEKIFYTILLFYSLYKEDENVNEILMKCNELDILVDLWISKDDIRIKDKVERIIIEGIEQSNTNIIIPLSKLMLSMKIRGDIYVKFLLLIYYDKKCEEDAKQYLNLFFFEYFYKDCRNLINVFCEILYVIENKKSMVGQSLFWVENSLTSSGLQTLFYKICTFAIKNHLNEENEDIVDVLSRIEISDKWDIIMQKKILYCCEHLLSLFPENIFFENIIYVLKSLIDEVTLEQEIIEGIKLDIDSNNVID